MFHKRSRSNVLLVTPHRINTPALKQCPFAEQWNLRFEFCFDLSQLTKREIMNFIFLITERKSTETNWISHKDGYNKKLNIHNTKQKSLFSEKQTVKLLIFLLLFLMVNDVRKKNHFWFKIEAQHF